MFIVDAVAKYLWLRSLKRMREKLIHMSNKMDMAKKRVIRLTVSDTWKHMTGDQLDFLCLLFRYFCHRCESFFAGRLFAISFSLISTYVYNLLLNK